MTRLLRRRGARGDDGWLSLELLGIAPLALLFALFALQIGVILWGFTSTSEGVRQIARASSLGEDGCAMRGEVVSSRLIVRDCQVTSPSGEDHLATLVVEVPMIGAVDDLVPDVVITRQAHLP